MTAEIMTRDQATFAMIEEARRAGQKAYLVGCCVVLAGQKLDPNWCLISVPVFDGPHE